MIIPPEIKNDDFYFSIIELIEQKSEEIDNILEIGASSGDGSTEAILTGIQKSNKLINLFSFEINTDRFANLKNRYKEIPNFYPINKSSVDINEYMSIKDIEDFHKNIKTKLNFYDLNMVIGWQIEELNYIKNTKILDKGIENLKAEKNISSFDLCLIDGSAFTGFSEFNLVKDSKYILLDDIDDIKNYHAHQYMKNDKNYLMLKENFNLRNGFSIWKNLNCA